MRTCIRYHGGKSYLAPKLVGLMPVHQRYLEPYFGGFMLGEDEEYKFLRGFFR